MLGIGVSAVCAALGARRLFTADPVSCTSADLSARLLTFGQHCDHCRWCRQDPEQSDAVWFTVAFSVALVELPVSQVCSHCCELLSCVRDRLTDPLNL